MAHREAHCCSGGSGSFCEGWEGSLVLGEGICSSGAADPFQS